MWPFIFLVLALLVSPILQFSWYYFVFGLWPISWPWLIALTFVSWGYSELLKKLIKMQIEGVK